MKSESARNNSSTKHKIFIVDDHPVLREGLARVIQQESDLMVCGDAADAVEALKKIEKVKPDLAIVELSLNGMNGLDLIKTIRSKSSKIRLLVFSAHRESLYAERALKAGANGYVMKRESGQKLVEAIRTVLNDKTHLSQEVNQLLIEKLMHPKARTEEDPSTTLTDRELETFRLIGQGLGTRQIAEALHISMKTVEAHREHIRAKYHFDSNYQLVQKAIQWVYEETHFI